METKWVNKPIVKLDAMALSLGKPVYTDDIAPQNALIIKLVRSKHAFAKIKSINTERALKVDGIVAVYTHEDMPKIRYTFAGQTYPEPSPYDRYILDPIVRYVGDPVAIIAGETQDAVNKAAKLVKVEYEVMEPVLDFEKATQMHPVHPEDDHFYHFSQGEDVKHNVVSTENMVIGDTEAAFADCDVVVERTFYTKANQQAMMEPFTTYTYLDYNGRLTVVSSTQIPFHVRRITAHALGLRKSDVRVIKPRIGGGFGAKQTMVCELFPAIVTMKTGRPAKIVYDRNESFSGSNSRHQMRVTVKAGATKDGIVKAIDMRVLSNAGAYAEHATTTVGLVGHKTLPLFGKCKAYNFETKVVYTNTMAGGAFRGYGATQGCFAMMSVANEIAAILKMDASELFLKNIPQVGDVMPAYYGETLGSSKLRECIETGKKMIDWDNKYPMTKISDTKYRGVGMSITMQGSGISNIDVCSATIRLNDEGYFTLLIGATDMGTGCDTILAQMAADTLGCDMANITVSGVDTDSSPFDKGSYASSSTYVTGAAVVKACEELNTKIREAGAKTLKLSAEECEFDGERVYSLADRTVEVSLQRLAELSVSDNPGWLTATATHCSPISPPPLMAGFAEVEVDTRTGKVEVLDYVGVVDCGTVINTNLARVQAEGGIAQGIGMALYEDVQYNENGKMMTDSYMQYKIPSRLDLPNIRVAFEQSYEKSGPFGAKSIGEVVINTPVPAIASAIYNAVGVRLTSLPMTPEAIKMALLEKDKK